MRDDGTLEGATTPLEASPQLRTLLARLLAGGSEASQCEVEVMLAARGADFHAVCAAADELRKR
jgi:hypothetical protein